jgi:ABC-type dipeptide/oligopeptide/nickel transport system ATPase component
MISTGLNVMLGARSSGKTHTLDRISGLHPNVKYIQQFELVQHDGDEDAREFGRSIERSRSQYMEDFLAEFKTVLNDVMRVDLRANERAVESYVESLLRSAAEADKQDAFSQTALFGESEFRPDGDQLLSDLIQSVRQLIENVAYRPVIEKHIDRSALQRLALELVDQLRGDARDRQKKLLVDSLVADIRQRLKVRTAAVQVADVDLYGMSLDRKRVERFEEIVRGLRANAKIHEEGIQGFTVVARKGPYSGAGEIKKASGIVAAFSDAFSVYSEPYSYLQRLRAVESLKPSELYKLFTRVSYTILNRDGYAVSGGERSEFRLLQEIADAQNYDLLLVDEPESSFDNLFLHTDVNEILREIAQSMPVIVVTHNSTVGASIHPDYVLYASKDVEGEGIVYRLYTGHPADRQLTSVDGAKIDTSAVMLNALEAGRDAYDDRRVRYEALADQ